MESPTRRGEITFKMHGIALTRHFVSASHPHKLCPKWGRIWTTCMGLMSTTNLTCQIVTWSSFSFLFRPLCPHLGTLEFHTEMYMTFDRIFNLSFALFFVLSPSVRIWSRTKLFDQIPYVWHAICVGCDKIIKRNR